MRWLDDTEQQAWLALVRSSARLLDALESELSAEHGLLLGDYEILVNLVAAGCDGLRMSDLADRVMFSRSRLTHRMNRLVEEGLVARESCPTDRRGAMAVITAAGRQRFEEAAPTHVAGLRRHLVERLDRDELQTLAAILVKVLDGLGDRFEPPELAALRCDGGEPRQSRGC